MIRVKNKASNSTAAKTLRGQRAKLAKAAIKYIEDETVHETVASEPLAAAPPSSLTAAQIDACRERHPTKGDALKIAKDLGIVGEPRRINAKGLVAGHYLIDPTDPAQMDAVAAARAEHATVPSIDRKAAAKLARKAAIEASKLDVAKVKAERKASAAKPAKGKAGKAKAKAAPKRARIDGKPSDKVAEILRLAGRKNGVSPQELNDFTTWKGAPWKWLFQNPKKNGYCDRFGYSFEAIKEEGKGVRYHVAKL